MLGILEMVKLNIDYQCEMRCKWAQLLKRRKSGSRSKKLASPEKPNSDQSTIKHLLLLHLHRRWTGCHLFRNLYLARRVDGERSGGPRFVNVPRIVPLDTFYGGTFPEPRKLSHSSFQNGPHQHAEVMGPDFALRGGDVGVPASDPTGWRWIRGRSVTG